LSSTIITDQRVPPSLAIIGGGLAGIAAAESALRNGFRVALFERSRVLGGRAASLFEPVSGQWIDNGQHVVLGCCTELLDLNKQLHLSQFFEQKKSIPFAQTDGKHWIMAPSTFLPFLPHCWQLFPSFLTFPFLSLKERFTTGWLLRLLGGTQKSQPETFAQWLAVQQVSANAIEKFWAPLVFSTLSETIEQVSLDAVRQIIHDGFLSGQKAMTVHIPTVPLRTIYHETVTEQLRNQGAELHFLKRVKRFCWEFPTDPNLAANEQTEQLESTGIPKINALELADGSRHSFDYYLLAVPSFRFWEIMAASDLESYTEQLGLERFEPGAITTLHLWFNRRLLPPNHSHTALLGGPGQFLFCPGKSETTGKSVYHNVVISASHRLLAEHEFTSRGSSALVEQVLQQLKNTFKKSFQNGTTQLEHHRVTTYFDAVFSPTPSVYLKRPEAKTPFANLALAGDWTQTKLPATLESAVRSGRNAVQILFALANESNRNCTFQEF
jgi:squalene-associated FAD-dependent desaturase